MKSMLGSDYLVFGVIAVFSVSAVPAVSDSLGKHYGFINQQDFYSILTSIEGKLGDIDQILIHHTNYNVRNDIAEIHRRLDSLDGKIDQLQTINAKCLENIHEEVNNNIVSVKRAIQEDIKGILSKTADGPEGSDIILKLEKIEDELTSRDEETKTELSDIIALLEDLKTPCSTDDSYYDGENTSNTSRLEVNICNETCTTTQGERELEGMKDEIINQNEFANWTTNFLLSMKDEWQQDMNNYANKVADMNLENWESNKMLGERIKSLQKFMVQMSRRLQRNSTGENPVDNGFEEMTHYMNANFEKILSTQNLFLESCYKLQNDDSQIEFKLGNFLRVIVEKLEEKVIIGTERIQNVTLLITDQNELVKDYLLMESDNHGETINKKHMNENNRKPRNSLDIKTASNAIDDISPFLQYANLKEFYVQGGSNENSAILTQSKYVEAHIIETQQNWLTPHRNIASNPEISNTIQVTKSKNHHNQKPESSENVTHKNDANVANFLSEINRWNELNEISTQKNAYKNSTYNGMKINEIGHKNANDVKSEDKNRTEIVTNNSESINQVVAFELNSAKDYEEGNEGIDFKSSNIDTDSKNQYDIIDDTTNEDEYDQAETANPVTDSISNLNVSEDTHHKPNSIEMQTITES